MTRSTVLLTGFEPFAGDASNPSWDAVELAASLWDGEASVKMALLPVEFDRCDAVLSAAMADTSPDLVIAVGLAGGIRDLHLERVAINVDDARIPDNAGAQPIDRPIVTDGPAAYFTKLPIKAVASALAAEDIAASISQSAGTFVCNHVFYSLMATGVHGGFVHVPYSPELAAGRAVDPVASPDASPDAPSMPLEQMARGILSVMRTSLLHREDDSSPGGALF